MDQRRTSEISLIAVAIAAFTVASFLALQDARKAEPLLFIGLLVLPLIAVFRSKRRYRWTIAQKRLVGIAVFFLAGVKHFWWPCKAAVYSFFSFSLVFHLAQACAVLATFELYQEKPSRVRLVVFSLILLIASSYNEQPSILLPAMVIYIVCLIYFSRCQLPAVAGGRLVWRHYLSMAGVISICLMVSLILLRYRESLNNWRPFQSLSSSAPYPNLEFSSTTDLTTPDIEMSNQTVLRYRAAKKIYYLRGKSFDYYWRGRWRLSTISRTLLTKKHCGQTPTYLLPGWLSVPDGCRRHSLVLLGYQTGVVFCSADCIGLQLETPVDLETNSEGIVLARQPLAVGEIALLAAQAQTVVELAKEQRQRYLQIPPDDIVFFTGLSQKIAGYYRSDWSKVEAIRRYLQANHSYSLKNRAATHHCPVQFFLKNSCAGHCAMFASALVLLLRAQGIPARYVGGYYAHEWNDWGKFITIRSADSHAWAEVYLPKQGWVTVDATPASSLQRILLKQRGFAAQLREAVAEWFRSWRRLVGTLLGDIGWIGVLGGMAAAWLLLRALRWARRSWKATADHHRSHAEIIPDSDVRLRRLFAQAVEAQAPRPRRSHESIRQYVYSLLPEWEREQRDFVLVLLTQVEADLYRESLPDPKAIDTLESRWRRMTAPSASGPKL